MASAVIGSLRVNLSADTAEFKRGLTDAERTAERFGRVIGSTIKAGALAFAGAVTAGAAALIVLTKNSFETISAQVDLAKRVGASVAAIQTLQYQTELSGGSTEALGKALGNLNRLLGEAAREGAGPAYEAIQRLGLSIQALSAMDADERIKALSDRMSELGYSTEQQAETLRSLGIKQQELINLFQEGSAAIDAARAELEAWGVLLSDVDAAKVEAAGDAWDKLHKILEGVGNQIAIRVAPLIQALAEYIGDSAKETKGFGDIIDRVILFAITVWAKLQEQVYRFRVELDSAIADVLNLWDAIAGAPANILATVFGGTAEDYGFKPVNEAYGRLKDNLAKPPSSEEWVKWYEEKKKQAEDAAKIAAETSRKIISGDTVNGAGTSDKDEEERVRFQEKLDQRLVALQESLMTEKETEMANYEERLLALEDFHNRGMLSDQQYKELLAKNQEQMAEKIKAIDDDIAENQRRNAAKQINSWLDIADTVSGALETLFGENKAVAIAQAIINTAQAITRSLAEYGATPLGLAAAAAAAAAGAAQIATITRTTKSSKGGGGGRASIPSAASVSNNNSNNGSNAGNGQTMYLSIEGERFGKEQVRALAEQLIEYQRDGGTVVLKKD